MVQEKLYLKGDKLLNVSDYKFKSLKKFNPDIVVFHSLYIFEHIKISKKIKIQFK